MTAVIFPDGVQLTVTADDIWKICNSEGGISINRAVTNGSQTDFEAEVGFPDNRTETWHIVVNRYSDSEHDLFARLGRQRLEKE